MTQEKVNKVYPRENCVRCSRRIDYEDEGAVCAICGYPYCNSCLVPGSMPMCIECSEELIYRGDEE